MLRLKLSLNNIKFLFVLIVFVQFGCNTTKYLSKNESLLWKNRTQILDEYTFDKKFNLNQELATLYKQKPNTRFLGVKRDWWHYYIEKHLNKKQWFYKTMAKYARPSMIVDTALCSKTCRNMENYFFNKGYFDASVYYDIKTKNKKSEVVYIVKLNEPTLIKSYSIFSQDSLIQKIVDQNQDEAILTKGKKLNSLDFQSEKLRLSELLFNNGYAEFNPIYFSNLKTDTVENQAKVTLNIENPTGSNAHRIYKIGKLRIFPEYRAEFKNEQVYFEYDERAQDSMQNFDVKPNFIRSMIQFKEGELYNKSKLTKTYLSLSQLGLYRFVSFDTKIDSINNGQVNVDILLSKNKKWIFDSGLDFNFTTVRAEGSNLLGLTAYMNLKNRNVFGGAESFSTKMQGGAELSIFNNRGINSIDLHYSNELVLPKMVDLTYGIKLVKWGLNRFSRNEHDNFFSFTNINVGFDYVSLYKQYNYKSFNSSIGYSFVPSRNSKFNCNTLNFSLYIPQTSESFNGFLDSNQLLKQSFTGNRLFTSFFLSDIQYFSQRKFNYRTKVNFYANFDVSGLEVGFVNGVYNLFKEKNEKFTFLNNQFSKFVKLELDQRMTTELSNSSQFVYRINIGVALPLFDTNSVPFIKQFYVGGPQSIRGWNVREPGPGGSNYSTSGLSTNSFFSTGDIKFETNLEYRYDIFLWLKGAFFLDVGNVWILPTATDAPRDAKFSKRFLDQLNVGTGTGLRLDMSYFVIRFDLGFKLRNAFKNENNKNWIYNNAYKVSVKNLSRNSTFHIAVNYPF